MNKVRIRLKIRQQWWLKVWLAEQMRRAEQGIEPDWDIVNIMVRLGTEIEVCDG